MVWARSALPIKCKFFSPYFLPLASEKTHSLIHDSVPHQQMGKLMFTKGE